jgi:amylosucrase
MYHPQLQTLLNAQLDKYQKQLKGRDFRDFATRLSANLHRITEVLNLIYGRRQEHPDYLVSLLDKLFELYQARPKALKDLDRQREKEADWLLSEKIVGMSLYVDRFSEDLEGFREKIDYLEELGVNWIHLMPLLQAPAGSNDGGYAVSNYRKVAPRFGSMEDIRKISEIFRERGMLLTLDLVMNHTSDQHEWAQKALQGDAHYQEYFYFFDDRSLPDQYEQSLPEVFPTSAPGNFTFQPQLGKWVMTVFHNYQWDLNYRNPEVLIEMLANLLFLANQGVDIIRIDAPAFIWKQMGTDSQNLPEAHLLLQLVKACSQVVAPGVAFIAEAIVAPQEIIKYFGEGPQAGRECEIAYNATFMALLWEALATQDTRLLRRGLSELPAKPYGTTWITYVRCHDDIGLGYDDQDIYAVGYDPQAHREFLVNYYSGKFEGSPATGAPFMSNPKTGDARISGSLASLAGLESALAQQDEKAIDLAVGRVLMLQGLALAYGGLPMLYYGDELGTLNDYSYQEDPDKAYDNRWMHRVKVEVVQFGRTH